MTSRELREKFLAFFSKKGHRVVKSASLLPHDDPTLLFTNAGMVQFKRIFLGEEKRAYVRATSSQKCVRAGGKHNDLENVGRTRRHHTFFEMLGNFSFGDYFKEEAIEFAWDLLINGYGLPADKLWVSVFKEDDDAYDLWHKKMGVAEDRIVRLGEKDNFWSMGDTGPCGPCSEILIDQGESFGCKKPDCRAGCDCDRYLELWNLVFMQFNRDESGEMIPLPRPSIDTGMGLERIAAATQGGESNYDTDLFQPIIRKVEELSGRMLGEDASGDVSIKVVADHSRAAVFLIGDGILPSNEGRGYVLRRILRRAIRHGRFLGMTRPFFHKTAESVIEVMSDAYPELSGARAYIQEIVVNEEERFVRTLDHGLKVLDEALAGLKAKGETTMPGSVIFNLYDTFGFPVDIIRDVVRDDDMTLDMQGFSEAMDGQRARSRASWKGIGEWGSQAYRTLFADGVKTGFVGYDELQHESMGLLLLKDAKEVAGADKGDAIELVTAVTPFYGEAGGQTGDQGRIRGKNGEMEVAETVKTPGGIIIHKGKLISGRIEKGETLTLCVDKEKRKATALNHTTTHILHAVLRNVLGDHVKQAGSLVTSDRFRFDFTHFSAIDDETILKIETLVNEQIRANTPVTTEEMDAEAAQTTGAVALFEEKYGDRVRVVSIGDFSKELCGGTHTKRTGDAGVFKILSEASVAAGIRRIEAVTGKAALGCLLETTRMLHDLARMLKARPEDLTDRISKLIDRQKALEKEIASLKTKSLSQESDRFSADVKTINGIQVLAKVVEAETPAALRDLADRARDQIESGIIVLGSAADSKAFLVVVVTKDHVSHYNAGKIIKQIAPIVGGGGGGRLDMAQAGGSKPEKLAETMLKVYDLAAQGFAQE
jgi:alanyl-tRNA synthetase